MVRRSPVVSPNLPWSILLQDHCALGCLDVADDDLTARELFLVDLSHEAVKRLCVRYHPAAKNSDPLLGILL